MQILLRRMLLAFVVLALMSGSVYSEDGPAKGEKAAKTKLIPRFLMVISEQNIGTPLTAWWATAKQGSAAAQPGMNPRAGGGPTGGATAINLGLVENTFVEHFRLKGYQVVDHQVLSGEIAIPQPLRVVAPGNQAAAKIGDLFGSNYVIVGAAVATTTGGVGGSPIQSASANISVRVINAKTAEIVATGSQEATAMNANPQAAGSAALKKASAALAEKLVKAINSKPGIKAFVFEE